MDRTLKVKGKGKLQVTPDQISIYLDLKGCKRSYEDALILSSSKTDALKDSLQSLGFKPTDLKTVHFYIDTKYIDKREADGNYKRIFVGYEFMHHMKLSFPKDNTMLTNVLNCIMTGEEKPEIRIEYTVKNIEDCQNELLRNAIRDSKQKANVLAEAAGVTLKEIVNIEYSWQDLEAMLEPIAYNSTIESASVGASFDFEPEDLTLEETVAVIWNID